MNILIPCLIAVAASCVGAASAQTVPLKLAVTTSAAPVMLDLHAPSAPTAPMKLPPTLLVDAKGKVVALYEGQLALEAWDGVADLML